MNSRHLNDDLIQAFLDNETALPSEAGRHLHECSQCREAVETYRELYASLGTIQSPELSPAFADRVMVRVEKVRPVWMPSGAKVPHGVWIGAMVVGAATISAAVIGPTACQNLLAQFHDLWNSGLRGLETGTSKYLTELNLKPVTVFLITLTLGGTVLMDRLMARVRRSRRFMSLMI